MSSIHQFAQRSGYGHMVEPTEQPDYEAMAGAMVQQYENPALDAQEGHYSEMWAGNPLDPQEEPTSPRALDPVVVRRMLKDALVDKMAASEAYQAAQMEAKKP